MAAKWGDGYSSEITSLTVAAWRGREKQAASSGKRRLKLFAGKMDDGTTVSAEKKQLDPNNPGVIIKVNGSQKVQLSFNYVPGAVACAQAVAWAKGALAGGCDYDNDLEPMKEKRR
eukprot:4886188-Pyramimonas_sp.AAC.1